MHTRASRFSSVAGVLSLLLGGSTFVFCAGAPAQTLNLPDAVSNYVVDDDDVPEVTARVARLSFVSGDAQIRRAGADEWEKATLNLPVVDGDELSTGLDSRLEIQFDNYQHLRLAENSYLKVAGLKDEGIALSLSVGTLSVRVTRIDKDKSYLEIDAPKSTVAVLKAGEYRVDAGQAGDPEIRVSVTRDGEARVYSVSAGFTLKNGRSARVIIDGPNAGEWEASDASPYATEFDRWSADRDLEIAQRLSHAFYDQYYDNDIYGAEDLNDNGEWIHTSKYGYVWRPFASATQLYADWTPYRYGAWRWIPPYGWTWVNDEPWGWATYHHGRWLFDDGYWYWSPYAFYRSGRSWWFPALVVINVFDNNVCWYPLPYHRWYYNYNANYYPHNPGASNYPVPPIFPPGITPRTSRIPKIGHAAATDVVPPTGVIAVNTNDFGTRIKNIRTAPLNIAKSVLIMRSDDAKTQTLPTYADVKGRMSREIVSDRPRTGAIAVRAQVGAAQRKAGTPLDSELRSTRVFGGRVPVSEVRDANGASSVKSAPQVGRRTGAVVRRPVRSDSQGAPSRTPVKVREELPAHSPVKPAPKAELSRQDPPKGEPTTKKVPPAKSGSKPDRKPAEKSDKKSKDRR